MAAKLPYKKIEEYGIVMKGLPLSKQLKHPSSYGRLTLKQILDNKESIKFEGINKLIYERIFIMLVYFCIVRSHLQVSSLPTIDRLDKNSAIAIVNV